MAVLSYDAWADRDCGILEPCGDADAYAAPMFRRGLSEALAAARRPALVVVCGSIGYIDSAGVSVLLMAYKRLRTRGGAVALCGVGTQLAQTLRITGLSKTLPEFPTVEAALNWFDQRDDAAASRIGFGPVSCRRAVDQGAPGAGEVYERRRYGSCTALGRDSQ